MSGITPVGAQRMTQLVALGWLGRRGVSEPRGMGAPALCLPVERVAGSGWLGRWEPCLYLEGMSLCSCCAFCDGSALSRPCTEDSPCIRLRCFSTEAPRAPGIALLWLCFRKVGPWTHPSSSLRGFRVLHDASPSQCPRALSLVSVFSFLSGHCLGKSPLIALAK